MDVPGAVRAHDSILLAAIPRGCPRGKLRRFLLPSVALSTTRQPLHLHPYCHYPRW